MGGATFLLASRTFECLSDGYSSIPGGHARGNVNINIAENSGGFQADRRTRVCLSGGERLMMLNAVMKGSEAFVEEQDLQGKMMAAFVGGEKRF
ncbi:hypothetical protein F2P79_013725 [Pimephales promelas]|nr:hypothetical protein F2P79_013725 [Pimephales promelas]